MRLERDITAVQRNARSNFRSNNVSEPSATATKRQSLLPTSICLPPACPCPLVGCRTPNTTTSPPTARRWGLRARNVANSWRGRQPVFGIPKADWPCRASAGVGPGVTTGATWANEARRVAAFCHCGACVTRCGRRRCHWQTIQSGVVDRRCQVFREFDPGASEAFAGFAYACARIVRDLMRAPRGSRQPSSPGGRDAHPADKGRQGGNTVTLLRFVFNASAVTALPGGGLNTNRSAHHERKPKARTGELVRLIAIIALFAHYRHEIVRGPQVLA